MNLWMNLCRGRLSFHGQGIVSKRQPIHGHQSHLFSICRCSLPANALERWTLQGHSPHSWHRSEVRTRR